MRLVWVGYCTILLFLHFCYAKNNTAKFSRIQDAINSLPDECNNVHGPHSRKCLSSLWRAIGCLKEGYGHPERIMDVTFVVYASLHLK